MREERVFLLRNFANIYFRPPDLLVPNLLSPFGEALVSSAKDLLRHDNVTVSLYPRLQQKKEVAGIWRWPNLPTFETNALHFGARMVKNGGPPNGGGGEPLLLL